MNESASAARTVAAAGGTAMSILAAISFCHLLNDMMQSLLPALYPMLRGSFRLSFTQIGLLTFTFQFTASLLQPLVGLLADRTPRPYSLATGMGFTLAGLLLLAFADSYALLLVAAALIGTGSSVFHPESSRVARMASGGKHGLAQSVFQVGGNLGTCEVCQPIIARRRFDIAVATGQVAQRAGVEPQRLQRLQTDGGAHFAFCGEARVLKLLGR